MGLIRALALAVLALGAGDAAEGHRFQNKRIDLYWYDLRQTVTWQSADDELRYDTRLRWQFSLTPLTVEPERAEVEARILQITAEHSGPGATHAVASNGPDGEPVGADDPLLGDLLALVDVPLILSVDPRTGVVDAVDGGAAIVEALGRRHPGPPGEPSPIVAAAERSYGSERLARLWSRLLMLPQEGEQRVALAAPLRGTAVRRWEGDRYSLSLPPGDDDAAPRAVLASAPNAIELVLEDLTGNGGVRLRDGILRHADGSLVARFSGTAMTQEVTQEHRLRWELGRIELAPDAAESTGDDTADPDAAPTDAP